MKNTLKAYVTIDHLNHSYTATVRDIKTITDYLNNSIQNGDIAIVDKIEGGWPELNKALKPFKPLAIT